MLPGAFASKSAASSGKLPEFVRRALNSEQMEIDSALMQMWYLLTQPTLVYKMSKARKLTKNHYHRDDPAFVVLQLLFTAVVTIAFGLALSAPVLRILYMVVFSCLLSYFVVAALASAATWALCNRVLVAPQVSPHEVRRDVEWQYCFDVHCNAYFAYFVYADVAHFFLLPVVMHSTFFSQLLANVLFLVGVVCYFYITFRGFVELPVVDRPQVFLYPIIGALTLCVLTTVTTHVNAAHLVLHHSWPLETPA